MKKFEKQTDIISKRLKVVDRITVAEGAELLGITESSVRRIFTKMEKTGSVIRVYGGIASVLHESNQYDYNVESFSNIAEKKRIASAAAKLVADEKNVCFDSGSTLYEVSLALANLLMRKPNNNLKIFSNSLKNLEVLQDAVSICLVGGDYRKARKDFCGFFAENAISAVNFDMCVLGTDGMSESGDLTTTDFDTAKLCSCALNHSKVRVLVLDSSKFGKSAFINYSNVSEFNIVVTDDGISEEYRNMLEKAGVKVVIA